MYDKRATIQGLPNGQIEWFNDFTANRNSDGKWTGSESFQCRLANAAMLIPVKGFPCTLPGWEFLKTTDVDVKNIEGDLALVTLRFGGVLEGDDGGDGGDETLDENSYTYELGITVGDEPVEQNFHFATVSKEEKKIIQNIKIGKYEQKKDVPFTYLDSQDNEFVIASDLGKELVGYIIIGVDTYLHPGQIWRATFTSNSLPPASILNSVGKITSAQGAPPIADDRNWLFLGINLTETDGVFTITYEWQLSGPGGFITNLYS